MIKTLTSTAFLAAMMASIGLPQSAGAAVLNTGDQISFGINAFQVNAAGLPPIAPSGPPGTPLSPPFFPVGLSYPSAGASAPDGGADGAFDVVFGTYDDLQPPNIPGLSASTRVSTNCFVSSDPANPARTGNVGPSSFCQVGNYGEVEVGPSSGGFTLAPPGTFGRLANFDNPSLAGIGFNFLNVLADPGFGFRFKITSPNSTAYLPVVATGSPQFRLDFNDSTNIAGRLLFNANGIVEYYNTVTNAVVESRLFRFDYTGTGIRDDGNGGDPVSGDGITARSTQAFAITILDNPPPPIPEPSTLGFLGTAVFMGLGARFLKRK